MSSVKIAISLEQGILERLDRIIQELKIPSRSKAIQQAILEKSRLARECAKLSRKEEQAFAEEDPGDLHEWPQY